MGYLLGLLTGALLVCGVAALIFWGGWALANATGSPAIGVLAALGGLFTVAAIAAITAGRDR